MAALAILFALYASVMFHELGHAVMGRLAGWRVTSFGTGLGRILFALPLFGVRIFVGISRPLSGVTFAFAPTLLPSRAQYVAYLSGGVLFNLILGGLAFGADRIFEGGGPFLSALAAVNLIQALGNALPFQANLGGIAMASDGARILQVMGRGQVDEPPVATLEAVRVLAPLWRATGDRTSHHIYALSAAQSCLALGDVEGAQGLLAEAESLSEPPSPQLAALASLVYGALALHRGRLAEAQGFLADADGALDVDDPSRRLALPLVGQLALARGDLPAARRARAALSAPGAAPSASLDTAALVLDLTLAEAAGEGAAVEEALTAYEARVAGMPPGQQSLGVYLTVLRHRARQQDWDGAADMAGRALFVLAFFHRSFALPEDRATFRARHEGLIARLKETIFWAERGPLDVELAAAFDPPDPQAAARPRGRRRHGLGLALTLAAALAVHVARSLGVEAAFPLMVATMASLYALPGGVLQIGLLWLYGLSGGGRRWVGILSLILGWVVWGAAIFTALLHLSPGEGL